MYKLAKLVALNFGNMARRDFEFSGELTLISGANGSGKSTIEDLIQCGMTGDTNNIVNYNAGQKEDTTKKQNETQRTFASYILGGEQLKFTRDEAIGVVALVFKNSVTGRTFTAWIYGEAEVEGKRGETVAKGGVKELGFCFNAQLNSNDFLIGEVAEGNFKSTKELKTYLSDKYKKDFYICDNKKEYLMKLYASFNNESSMPYDDAKSAAKAFVKYIYPTKASNVNSFVKQELLDRNNLDAIVKDLRESIHTFSRIQKEAEIIAESEKKLGLIAKECRGVLLKWRDYYDEEYLYIKREYYRNLETKSSLELKLEKSQNKQKQLEKYLQKLDNSEIELSEELKLLEALLEGNEKIQKRNELLKEIDDLKTIIYEIETKIKSSFDAFANAFTYLTSANQLVPIENYCDVDILNKLSEINNMTNEDTKSKSQKCNLLLKEVKSLISEKSLYFIEIDKEVNERIKECEKIDNELRDTKKELLTFSLTGKQHYPNQKDIDIIRESFPEANAVPLCELLDINDSEWQCAIEGLLGWNRFAIVVDRNYEVEATDLLRDRNLRSKVIQSTKVLYDYEKYTREIKYNSIVNLFEFGSDVAKAYIKLNYGNVLQYHSTSELISASRGLKKDGLAASGYATFKCGLDEKDCYIGEATKMQRHDRLLSAETRLREQLNKAEVDKIKANETRTKLLKLHLYNTEELIQNLEIRMGTIASKNDLIDAIDIKEEEESIHRGKVIKNTLLPQLIKDRKASLIETGSMEKDVSIAVNEIEICVQKSKNLDARIHPIETSIKKAQQLTQREDVDKYLEYLHEHSQQTYKDNTMPTPFHEKVKTALFEFEIKNNDYIKECAQIAMIEELALASRATKDISDFKELSNHYEEQKTIHATLLENVLRKKNEEVLKQKEKFQQLFQGEFCSRVYDSVKEGESKRIKLNRILRRNSFGNESFLIKSEFTSKYKSYYDYFEYIATSSESDQLDLIPENLVEAKELINKLLLETDDENAGKELQAISDYRNFKTYDIHKVFDGDEENSVSLSRLATDSGGQATTSYYIIRSIAAFSAFTKMGRRTNNLGLGFLMIDEAFNRVDEHRTGDILNYLTKTLGFQLIAATPTDKEASMVAHATDKYQVYKQVVNKEYDNYQVKQYYDLFILNSERIKELLRIDEARIRHEQGSLDI